MRAHFDSTSGWGAFAVGVLVLSTIAPDSVAQPAASASAKVVIPPWPEPKSLPAFDAEAFPDDKSKAPKLDEWTAAPEVRLTRVSHGTESCRAKRVREWLSIHCDLKTAGLRLLAGSTDGVALWVADAPTEKSAPVDYREAQARRELIGRYGEIVFPVRRGDRRVFEWFAFSVDSDSMDNLYFGSTSRMIVEEQWLEGAKTAEVALLVR